MAPPTHPPGPCLGTSQSWASLVQPRLGLCLDLQAGRLHLPGLQASLLGPSALATFLADLFFQAKVATDEGFSWTVMQRYLSEDPSLP